MIRTIIITLKECFEMALVITPILVYLKKTGKENYIKFVIYGCVMGVLASILSSVILYQSVQKLQGYSRDMFEGLSMLFLSSLIIYSIVLVRKNKNKPKNIETSVEAKTKDITIFLISFLTVFRESLEIIIFILPFMVDNIIGVSIGALIGFCISIILLIIMYKSAQFLNVNLIFTILNMMLIIMGAEMFGEGIQKIIKNSDSSIVFAGELAYAIPMSYFFLKREIKNYLKLK